MGSKKGAIAASVYALGGLVGIPWFALGGGIGYVFQPTFGFIIAFIPGSFIAGYFKELSTDMSQKKKIIMTIIGSVIATLLVWVLGILYLSAIYQYYLQIEFGVFIALTSIFSFSFLADLILAVLVSFVGHRIQHRLAII